MHNFESLPVTQETLKFVNFLINLEIQQWNIKMPMKKLFCFDFLTWQMKRFQNCSFEREKPPCEMAFSRKIWFFNIFYFLFVSKHCKNKKLNTSEKSSWEQANYEIKKMTSWNSKLNKNMALRTVHKLRCLSNPSHVLANVATKQSTVKPILFMDPIKPR